MNTQKGSVLYYQRIFEGAGIDTANAIVVDDSPADLQGVDVIGDLAELPALLRAGSAR